MLLRGGSTMGNANKRRRWYPFTLRTALVVVAGFCVPLAYVAKQMRDAQREMHAVATFRALGEGVDMSNRQRPGSAWLRRLLGENAVYQAKTLILNDTQVDASHLKLLPAMRGIERLWAEGNRFGDDILVHVETVTELKVLQLGGSRVTDLGLRHLRRLDKLQELRLNWTDITDDGLAALTQLTDLRRLDLAHTKVGDAGLRHLRTLKRLEVLNLASTDMKDAGLLELEGLQNITVLNLTATKITDVGLARLENLPRLKELDLALTSVTVRGVSQSRKSGSERGVPWVPVKPAPFASAPRECEALDKLGVWYCSLHAH